jgi:hypothetical protein
VRRLGAVKDECGTSWCSCHEYRQDLFGLFYEGRLLCAEGEDWSGEAALIEKEMKRFREWAALKVAWTTGHSDPKWAPPWDSLVVFQGNYEVVSNDLVAIALKDGARLVYSPGEAA